MNYKYTLTIEDENEVVVYSGETASWNDFEENIVRKAEHAVKEHEGRLIAAAEAEQEEQEEEDKVEAGELK